ncbi:dihydroxyacetone kinase phosphoryl donor subunit DhaM [Clostridium neuense]|uniref:phosphoenolpyruvate--glycerone phosphotransferase n=1 Tax=Clostridium neuense TaxID=1728934 RepID=A0ABW8TDJ7_9CLOT
MVGIVLVSHSNKIAEGIKEVSLQMASQAKIAAAGGTRDERIGTDVNKILEAIQSVYSEDGVIILFDLGSSCMNAEMAIEFLDPDKQNKVEIVDAALVEGAIVAAVESTLNKNITEIKNSIKSTNLPKRA